MVPGLSIGSTRSAAGKFKGTIYAEAYWEPAPNESCAALPKHMGTAHDLTEA